MAAAPAWCTTFCPPGDGLISTALIHRSSVRPESAVHSGHQSGPTAGTVTSTGFETIKSGVPIVQRSFGNVLGGGMSAGLPCGAPCSAHLVIVAISASVSDGSPMNFCTPILRSTYHGGISRFATLVAIERAHGRASL